MKVWINKYLKKAKLTKQSYKRDGNKLSRLELSFNDGSNIKIDMVRSDFEKISKVLDLSINARDLKLTLKEKSFLD